MKKMGELVNMMKQLGAGAVDAGNPVTIVYGEVTQINPLEVNVDQRFTLSEDFLIVPEQLTSYEIDLKHTHSYSNGTTGESLVEKVVIRRGLEAGDKLLLLRVQGGQQYIIFDRVVEA
jgi:hypothetical protein